MTTNEDLQREQWLEERKSGIGGSEASALLGMNPYMDIQKLYRLKKGLIKSQDISNVDCVKYGNDAEPYLRSLFALDFPRYQVTHEQYKVYRNSEYPFILGSLDGVLFDKETGEYGVLEIKTTNILQSMHTEKWRDSVPQNYFIQVLHYLLVTGYSFAILCAQLKTDYGGEIRKTTRHYTFKRADFIDDIEYLKNKEIDFWKNNILKNVEPSMILPHI